MAAAAATAAGVVVAGYLQKRASDNANKARGKATDSALTYQRETDAAAKAERDRAWADYEKRHAAWEARNFGGGAAPKADVSRGGHDSEFPSGGAYSSFTGKTVADLMGGVGAEGGQPAPAEMGAMPPGATLADLAQWSDHRQYRGGV